MNDNGRMHMVTQFLIRMGVPVRLNGFHFIREAIVLSLDNETVCYDMTHIIYPHIAEHNNRVSPDGAERGIRYAIHVTWEQSHSVLLESVFGYSNKDQFYPPSNREFIAAVTEYLRYAISSDTVCSDSWKMVH